MFAANWTDIADVFGASYFFPYALRAMVLSAVLAVAMPSASCAEIRAGSRRLIECVSLCIIGERFHFFLAVNWSGCSAGMA